jgi:hypothetical protein
LVAEAAFGEGGQLVRRHSWKLAPFMVPGGKVQNFSTTRTKFNSTFSLRADAAASGRGIGSWRGGPGAGVYLAPPGRVLKEVKKRARSTKGGN